MNPLRLFSQFSRLKQRGGALARIGRAFRIFGPMTVDVVKGRYRPVPWSAFAWMALALVYLVSPFDLIPDFLMIIGVIDDIFIVGWLLTRVDRALAGYRRWKGIEVDFEEDSDGAK
ncbi:YkvA family protein [Salinicola aestuarinus]|uniref:YkvA family protein n=1 Tax=Salinicola aestuarinus TaxID=1949082 RepID=UPI000DA124FB|nr:DUF1232 domain-containing protein [Salinicola aestuarinus]